MKNTETKNTANQTANEVKKVNVYEQIDDFKNVIGFGICETDEDDEIDSIEEVEVGSVLYSTVPSVCFTFDKDELTDAGITEEMLIEDSNEKVIDFIKESVGTIGSEYELLCKCDGNYDEVIYSGIMEEEPVVEYFVNGEDDYEVNLCVTIPVKITVIDDVELNIEYIW